ncbi:unnamed protein product [Effrenium voratum]|nr:unnamed protein product [Effrenium voratum]
MRCVLFFAWAASRLVAAWHEPLLRGVKVTREETDALAQQAAADAKAEFAKERKRSSATERPCPSCGRPDWNAPCPVGWLAEGGECVSPPTYKGLCERRLSFALSTKKAKQESEVSCQVCFPCLDDDAVCERHWSAPCPEGYSPADLPYDRFRDAGPSCALRSTAKQATSGNVTGVADLDTPCEQIVSFAGQADKINFTRRCDLAWPCKRQKCAVHAVCPEGWTQIGKGVCAAPLSFSPTPSCPLLQSFRQWTEAMKEAFGESCGVEWSCESEVGSRRNGAWPPAPVRELELNRCPRGWQDVEGLGQLCEPPAWLAGPCGSRKSFKAMTDEEKIRWSSGCLNVAWPDKGEDGLPAPDALLLAGLENGPLQ